MLIYEPSCIDSGGRLLAQCMGMHALTGGYVGLSDVSFSHRRKLKKSLRVAHWLYLKLQTKSVHCVGGCEGQARFTNWVT